jgi:Cof subfamily protein (haloacid dehalogenase superfamily)
MRFLPKLVATDLDGTLVRTDETVSAYTAAILRQVRDAGIEVVGVTGRGPRLRQLSKTALGIARYLVCAQGGYVLDLDTDEVLHAARLGASAARQVLDLIESEVGPVLVTVEAGEEAGALLRGEHGFGWPWPGDWIPAGRAELFGADLLKMFVSRPGMPVQEFFDTVRALIAPELAEVTYAGLGFLEICPVGVTKAVGLAAVCGRLGVGPSDVLAFGDMPNDVPMLRWAGRAVAVANAHPEARAVADEVTASNDEDGVARYLAALLDLDAALAG